MDSASAPRRNLRSFLTRGLADYGMVFVLLLLCGFFTFRTIEPQPATSPDALQALARDVVSRVGTGKPILLALRDSPDDAPLLSLLPNLLTDAGAGSVTVVQGSPADLRHTLEAAESGKQPFAAIVASQEVAGWSVLQGLGQKFPAIGDVPVVAPRGEKWSNFLKRANLLNIVNQITVIAILGIGMTFVIIAGGIDLSVGSLIALAAVVATRLIRDVAGGEQATATGMILGSLGGIAVCGLVGAFSGVCITGFQLPPFLVTLSTMLVASGAAFLLSGGESVFQVPPSFVWLGGGADFLGIPNAVVLMLILYGIAHVALRRTTFGRYVTAVGGNPEAARLAGVPVEPVLVLTYAISGLLAGVGGVVMASQLKSGLPTFGAMYELYVIAAVVVGGTSLSGGEGSVFGTLVGALLIAVIQNGMNLTGVDSYTQRVVLGLVILTAILLDRLKTRLVRSATSHI